MPSEDTHDRQTKSAGADTGHEYVDLGEESYTVSGEDDGGNTPTGPDGPGGSDIDRDRRPTGNNIALIILLMLAAFGLGYGAYAAGLFGDDDTRPAANIGAEDDDLIEANDPEAEEPEDTEAADEQPPEEDGSNAETGDDDPPPEESADVDDDENAPVDDEADESQNETDGQTATHVSPRLDDPDLQLGAGELLVTWDVEDAGTQPEEYVVRIDWHAVHPDGSPERTGSGTANVTDGEWGAAFEGDECWEGDAVVELYDPEAEHVESTFILEFVPDCPGDQIIDTDRARDRVLEEGDRIVNGVVDAVSERIRDLWRDRPSVRG